MTPHKTFLQKIERNKDFSSSKLIKKFLTFSPRKKEILQIYFSLSLGSNQYLQDSCSDTENGLCDTDSFGSRLSGNGSSGVAGEFKHIKEEIENDEDYFRLLANQTRTMRHFDGKYERKKKHFCTVNIPDSFFCCCVHWISFKSRWRSIDRSPSCHSIPFNEGWVKIFMDFQWQLRAKVFLRFLLASPLSMPLSGLFVCFQTAGGIKYYLWVYRFL